MERWRDRENRLEREKCGWGGLGNSAQTHTHTQCPPVQIPNSPSALKDTHTHTLTMLGPRSAVGGQAGGAGYQCQLPSAHLCPVQRRHTEPFLKRAPPAHPLLPRYARGEKSPNAPDAPNAHTPAPNAHTHLHPTLLRTQGSGGGSSSAASQGTQPKMSRR